MKIGNVHVRNRVFLAPMVDITTLPYRLLCLKYGAGMVYSEMVVANSLVHNSKSALDAVKTTKEEHPYGVQLAGNDPELILRAAEKTTCDVIDLNFGCPSHKLLDNNMCSALLQKPEKIKEIITFLIENLDVPVTAKIRLGYKRRNFMDVAKTIENAGARALCVHGRTAVQGYKSTSDWEAIKEIKKSLSIPVIGNGDVFDGKSASALLDDVDFVMIGRAAIGDPFVFERIKKYLAKGESMEKPTLEDKYACFLEYVQLSKKHKLYDFKLIKRMSLAFAKNVEYSAKLRGVLNICETLEEIKERFKKFIHS